MPLSFDFLKSFYCHACDHIYPKSVLIDLNGHKYCTTCSKDLYNYCDGCGGDFPREHVVYNSLYDGYFCKRCDVNEN